MTKTQIEAYQKRYLLDDYTCSICGKPAVQMAHRLGQGEGNRKKYGNKIIDHISNIASSCVKCNDYFNIGFKLNKILKLIEIIKSNRMLTSKEISEELNDNWSTNKIWKSKRRSQTGV